MSPRAEQLDAHRTYPEWSLETDLGLPNPRPAHALALWGDVLVVLTGSVADIRALLVRALNLLPERE